MMKIWIIKHRVKVLLIISITAIISYNLLLDPFGYESVCMKCGQIKSIREWSLPFSDFIVYRSSSERMSKVTNVLHKTKLIKEHLHDWAFSTGSGNGVFCAIGPGRHIIRNIESEHVSKLLEIYNMYGTTEDLLRLIENLFDTEHSDRIFLLSHNLTENKINSQEDFDKWQREIFSIYDDFLL